MSVATAVACSSAARGGCSKGWSAWRCWPPGDPYQPLRAPCGPPTLTWGRWPPSP